MTAARYVLHQLTCCLETSDKKENCSITNPLLITLLPIVMLPFVLGLAKNVNCNALHSRNEFCLTLQLDLSKYHSFSSFEGKLCPWRSRESFPCCDITAMQSTIAVKLDHIFKKPITSDAHTIGVLFHTPEAGLCSSNNVQIVCCYLSFS